MKNATTLSTTQLKQQMATISERHGAIMRELQTICADAMRNGSVSSAELPDADERAARSHAISLLAGIDDTIALAMPPEVGRERALFRERRGIDIALKVLQEKLDEAAEAATLKWWKTAEPKWRDLVHEAVLAAVKLHALDRRAEALFVSVDYAPLGRIPLGNMIGLIAQTPIHELVAAALDAGVVTRSEIQEAEHAK